MQVFVIINNAGKKINVSANVKNLFIKVYVIQNFVGIQVIENVNMINDYLKYENCKCRKKLIDKLVGVCTENIEETRLVEKASAKNKNKHKCSSCTLYICS